MAKNLGMVVLDRSGSMSSMLEQTIAGVNNHIKTVSKDIDDVVWTLMMFDTDGIDYLYTAKKPEAVKQLDTKNFVPRAATPLLDAIGKALTDLDSFIDGLTESARPERVSIVIMTDGLENSSREYTHEIIRDMIKEREDRGWQVIYLGANQDAFSVGAGMGITTTRTFSPETTGVALAAASTMSSSYYASGQSNYGHEDLTAAKWGAVKSDEDEES